MQSGQSLSFFDLNFARDLTWLTEVVAALKGAGAADKWHVGNLASRTNLITEELHAALRPIQPARMGVGMESLSQRILSKLKPACTIEDHERAVRLSYKHKVQLCASFIIGTPGETAADLQATYDFIKHWQGKYFMQAGLFILTPYPGTVWWDFALEHGLVKQPTDWKAFHCCIGQADWSWDTSLYMNEQCMPRKDAQQWQQKISALCAGRDATRIVS
jgi:radical SAM superfamily enzyme YgiQ (UPF0313 family)